MACASGDLRGGYVGVEPLGDARVTEVVRPEGQDRTPKGGVAGSNPAGGTRQESPDRSRSGDFGIRYGIGVRQDQTARRPKLNKNRTRVHSAVPPRLH